MFLQTWLNLKQFYLIQDYVAFYLDKGESTKIQTSHDRGKNFSHTALPRLSENGCWHAQVKSNSARTVGPLNF